MAQVKSILIVEDDDAIRNTLRLALEYEGYPVVTAENGQDALDVLSRVEAPRLILLDLMMPVMDGWGFVEALKTRPQFAGIPVVIVTAFSEQAREISADAIKGIMRKPIDLDALVGIAKQYCA